MFLMMSMLGGLITISIPVIIHLLHRQKTTPIKWGAMQFLVESQLQHKRRRFVEHWLLMLARVALLALLVFALARPMLNADLVTPMMGNASTDVAIVIDHSLSTGRLAEPGKTVFAKAIDTVDQIAGSMKGTDSMAIVLAEHTPRAIADRAYPMNSSELGNIRKSLKEMKPGLTDANLVDAVRTARDVLNRGRGINKKIIIISDEQKIGWQIDNAAAWKLALGNGAGDGAGDIDRNIAVFNLPVAPDASMSNVSVSALELQPNIISPNHPIDFVVTISQSGPVLSQVVAVTLNVDGTDTSKQAVSDLSTGGSRTLRFSHTFKTAGSHFASIRADVKDGFEADNVSSVALNVIDRLPILIIDGQLTSAGNFRSSQFLNAAMQPEEDSATAASVLAPKMISLSDAAAANFNEYAAVVVNDVPRLPSDVLTRLADYAKAGHGVCFVLGGKTLPTFVNESLSSAGFLSVLLDPVPIKIEKDAPTISVADPSHRMISLLTQGDRSALTGVVVTQYWKIKPNTDDVRTILKTAGGDPVVLDRPVGNSGGRVVLWSTSADGKWNTIPLSNGFVPLIQETLFHLAGPQIVATQGRNFDAGKPIVYSNFDPKLIKNPAIRHLSETGVTQLAVTPINGRPTLKYDKTFLPGMYELKLSNDEKSQPIYYSLGIDSKELDQTALAPKDIDWLKDNGFIKARISADKVGLVMTDSGGGRELWPLLAFAVLGFLVLETLMTYRMMRHQTAKPTMSFA